jgi:WS/DGAT/MGAT family acyltransferase
MDRLTPLAVAFLDAEDADSTACLAIGSLAIFEGPAPRFTHFVKAIEGRLPLIPRYRQKLRMVPFDLGPPVWVDDASFDLSWHIRNTALPAPGGPAEIGRFMSRVMTQRMDRSRPLWEYWFCEGLADGRWALLSKLHHSLADGVSGTDLYRLVLDASREQPAPVPDHWQPTTPPSAVALTARAVWELAATPASGARAIATALRSPTTLIRQAGHTAKGLVTLTGALPPVHGSSLTGPLDGSRRYAWTTVSLEDIRTVCHRFGTTVNDVALAMITGGFRQLLLSRDEEPNPHLLRSLVPVSTREPGEEAIPDNRVSLMLPYLPVDIADPQARLAEVAARIRKLRSAGEPAAGGSITTAAEYSLFPTVSLGIRLGLHLPQHQVSTVTTNVPGPRQALYGLGRELQEILPYVPIADRVRIGVAIFSYRGAVTFGITADYASVPDIDRLAQGIADSLAELVKAAEQAE